MRPARRTALDLIKQELNEEGLTSFASIEKRIEMIKNRSFHVCHITETDTPPSGSIRPSILKISRVMVNNQTIRFGDKNRVNQVCQ